MAANHAVQCPLVDPEVKHTHLIGGALCPGRRCKGRRPRWLTSAAHRSPKIWSPAPTTQASCTAALPLLLHARPCGRPRPALCAQRQRPARQRPSPAVRASPVVASEPPTSEPGRRLRAAAWSGVDWGRRKGARGEPAKGRNGESNAAARRGLRVSASASATRRLGLRVWHSALWLLGFG